MLCFLAYAVSYFGRNTFAACITDMVESGVFEKGFDSYISTAFLVCYGAGQFINGRLTAKFSPKLYAPLGLLGSGLSNILMALFTEKYVLCVLWAVNGFCCSMLWPTVIRIFTEWLNDSERPSATANISPSIPVGSIICYLICSVMLGFSWKAVFILSGCLLCIGAGVWTVSVIALGGNIDDKARDTAQLAGLADAVTASAKKQKLSPAYFFATGLGVMAILSILSGTLKEAVINWIPTFLTDCFGYSTWVSALISTLMPLAGVLGPYFAIWINKKIDNEATTIACLMGISGICNGIILATSTSVAVAAIAMLAVSTACMWGINTMLMTFTCYHFKNAGLSSAVTGTLNALVYVGSSSFTYLYRTVNESAGSWLPVVGIWTALGAAACVFGLVAAPLWKKKRPI
ncbi:MAG: MFS transporter [Clostridia bacterium]|nr:MFS transporter [Clostridia bacterium]